MNTNFYPEKKTNSKRLSVCIYIMCHFSFCSLKHSSVLQEPWLIRIGRNRTEPNDVQKQKCHGGEKRNLSIYNLTKLKGNETEENKQRNLFVYKEKKNE